MNSVLCRRNSMTSLSLFDLETFIGFSKGTSPNVNEDRKIELQIKSISSKTILEHLPNELLIYIFQYLSPYDLHRALYNFNYRLNTICHTQKLHLNLGCAKRSFDYYCSNQQPFASQIYSLKLDDNCDRLTFVNLYINIDLFINLRALTIKSPSPENLDKILSKLHLLSHLSYLNIYRALIQSLDITMNIFKIRSLKRLIIYSVDPIIFHFDENLIQPLTELEYLGVDGCYLMEFLELLKYVGPNVKRMKINIHYHRQQTFTLIDPMQIDQLLLNDRIPVLLQRLEMSFNFLLLTNFQLLLRLFPHLMYLTFSTISNDFDIISPLIWHDFISINLLELKQLQFVIQIMNLMGNIVQYPSTELIDSFYSYNNKWLVGPVVMDYNSLVQSKVFDFYTCPQCVYISKSFLELYGTKRYMSTTIKNLTTNINKNITKLRIMLADDQQVSTTDNLLLSNENSDICPNLTGIHIHSQMTRLLEENDKKIGSILTDIMKSIPDLSKIKSLSFTMQSSIHPPITLTRRILDKMPKINQLTISYNYLLCLLKSPLIVIILTKKIENLTIQFDTDPPLLPDMIRIFNIFSIKLRFLYLDIRTNLPVKKFYLIIPLLFSEICKQLLLFQLRLSKVYQQQPQIFDEQFKLRIKKCLTAQIESKSKFKMMEYRIQDNELLISF